MATGHHELSARNDDVKMGSERGFGIVFAVVFAVIGLWPTFKLRTLPHVTLAETRLWAIAVAALFLTAGLLAPAVLKPLNRLWFKFGLLLGRIMNPIIMGVLFYGVFTPFGLVMRLFGKDPLRLKHDRAASSYWIRRTPPGPTGESMRNQF